MMYFCSETGLPVVAPKAGTGRTQSAGLLPDLLEDQQAQIQLMCDCGAASNHQVACALSIKGNRSFPSSQRVDLVVCPSCGDKIPLLRPLVLHDEPRKRVVLRLPESFRSRAHTVLSWWHDWCQRSSRPVLPAYVRTPELEFLAHSRPSPSTGAKTTPSQPSMSHVPSVPAPGRAPATGTGRQPARNTGSVNALPSPLATVRQDKTKKHPNSEPIPAYSSAEADPTRDANHQKSLMESLLPPAIAKPSTFEVEDTGDAKISDGDSKDKTRTSTPAVPGGSSRKTIGFGSQEVARMVSELSYGELPLDELSGEFKGLDDEVDEGVPTLMVAAPEPSKKGKSSTRRTVGLSSLPSVVVSPESELSSLHNEEGEDESTIVRSESDKSMVRVMTREDASMSAMPLDPGATREAPAPILSESDLAAMEAADSATPTRQDRRAVRPSASRELEALAAAALEEVKTTEPLADPPTVARRMAPQSLSEIRASQSKATTAIRNIVGNGVSSSPEYDKHQQLSDDILTEWKASENHYHYGMSLSTQRCTVNFQFPSSKSRILDQGGDLQFYIQLHRLPSYPLVVLLFDFRDAHGESQDILACPLDIEDHNVLIFLDMLMQDFVLHCNLCDENFAVYRDLQVQLPLEDNVEYLLEKARVWKNSINTSSQSFSRAWREFNTPGYDQLGKMEHNFSRDSFTDIKTPAQAQLASGIVAYWSEPEQYDYLLTMKSFPVAHFQTVQRRTVEGCLSFGIFLPEHLRLRAIDFGLVENQQELLQQLLSSFAETNLAIRQANDLDPWDNLTNWQKLLDTCDEFHVEVDEDIEELAELAQRRCQSDGENTHNVDDEDIVEIDGYQDMDPRELLELLQDQEHRLEAALALCDTQEPEYADYVAGVFANLERDDAITLAEAFTQFGSEAEPLLISWLHLPRPYHREAAMLALGTMSSTQAIDEIIKRLRSGEEWETAAEALGRIGEPAIDALSTEITNKNWLIRLRAVKALQKISSGKTRALFEQLQSDPNEVVKAEVAMILNG